MRGDGIRIDLLRQSLVEEGIEEEHGSVFWEGGQTGYGDEI